MPEISAIDIEKRMGKDYTARARWGEMLVANICETMSEFKEISWVNRKSETCLPYDVTAVQYSTGNVLHIEVKTSISAGTVSNTFIVSENEIVEPCRLKASFEFWLVHLNSETSTVSITRLQNPSGGCGVSIVLLCNLV